MKLEKNTVFNVLVLKSGQMTSRDGKMYTETWVDFPLCGQPVKVIGPADANHVVGEWIDVSATFRPSTDAKGFQILEARLVVPR